MTQWTLDSSTDLVAGVGRSRKEQSRHQILGAGPNLGLDGKEGQERRTGWCWRITVDGLRVQSKGERVRGTCLRRWVVPGGGLRDEAGGWLATKIDFLGTLGPRTATD